MVIGVKYAPKARVVWRRVLPNGMPAAKTRTVLRPHEEENVLAAVNLLHRRLGTWGAVSVALNVPVKTMDRVRNRQRRVQEGWAIRVARALGMGVDDVLAGRLPAPGACPTCGRRNHDAAHR